MTMIAEFETWLSDNASALDAWGSFVVNSMLKLASQAGVKPQMSSFRSKDVHSAIGKIARKGYKKPISEMTDLVGARVVVLLSKDLRAVANLLNGNDYWDVQLARDPDEEVAKSPEKFDYQSLHYELRAKADSIIDGVSVPKGLCCELQIRTLMQHAYAEVAHDSIYKSTWPAPVKARRYIASSAALIDTADHLFCETMEILAEENKARGELLEQLSALYDAKISPSKIKDQKLNMVILDEFEDELQGQSTLTEINDFLTRKTYIADRIKERAITDPFWAQPVVILAYWLVSRSPYEVFDKWPFAGSHDALDMVYSDLGLNH
ncbi:ppGpp synthetase/RelA/SpoT-type nucleotidyltransferase [Rheinheimera pacifica]|uniref:GTP pyrophosphokinase n=1 Tax=Rheinheimera pacifica TaxID=173990 RepID=UPI00216A274D|nr:RelA/SpoT domain-containing protein [Rheinheimera pacifica]MCS4305719.1 ppGpp synthetase/RelA/SpoT-type nucleotidyltransferase [Rheinheimera pacifica]